MKAANAILYFFLVAVMAISCGKSFLDNPPRDVILREAYAKDLHSCQELLNGSHVELVSALGLLGLMYGDLMADNIKPFEGQTYFSEFYKWNLHATRESDQSSGSELNANYLVYQLYSVARSTSFIIERATGFRKEDPQWSDQIVGSAMTIRVLVHSALLNILAQPANFTSQGAHAGIVYVTSSDWTRPPALGRESVGAVYGHLQEELKKAAELMGPIKDENTAFSRDMAYALLSRISLYAGNYTGALEAAKKALEGHPLLTIEKGYPDGMYRSLKMSESESYYQLLPAISNELGNNGYSTGFPSYLYRYKIYGAGADIAASLQTDPADVRSGWVTKEGDNWSITKFPMGVVPDVDIPETSYFLPIVRVSEVVLNAAEAAYYLQQPAQAQMYLNQIRLRARPGALPIMPTGTALQDAIRTERNKELAFEGSRLFDLLRWKMAVKRSDPADPEAALLPYPSNRAVAPIPQMDISANIPQNPGY